MDEEKVEIKEENIEKIQQETQETLDQEKIQQEVVQDSIVVENNNSLYDDEVNKKRELEEFKQEIENKKKKAFTFTCIGLLLDLVIGVGAVFSLIGLIMSLKNPDKKSSSIRWSIVLGIIGVVVGVVFFGCVIYYISIHSIVMPDVNNYLT